PSISEQRKIEPVRLAKLVRGELDWIVMKALEKDRARRYATPNEMAEDVERHLNGLPILAAPPSLMYQASKIARKYRVAVTAGVMIALVLVIAIAAVSGLAIELSHQVSVARAALSDAQAARAQESAQRQEAERERESAESAAHSAKYEAARNQAQYLISQKLLDQALVAAKEAYQLGGDWRDGLLLSQIVNESRNSWRLEHSIPVTEAPICGAISQTPGGMVLVVAYPYLLAEYDLVTGKLLAQTTEAIAISQLLSFRAPQDQIAAVTGNSLALFSLSDLTLLQQQDFGSRDIIAADAGNASIAVTLSDHTTLAYSSNLARLGFQPWPKNAKLNYDQPLAKLAISPDGQWVASSGQTWWDDCLLWNTWTGKTFLAPANSQAITFLDNSHMVGVQNSIFAGIGLLRLSIDADHSTLDRNWICTLPPDDIGTFPKPSASTSGVYLGGDLGFGEVTFGPTSSQFPSTLSQRYASLLGRNDLSPAPLALAADKSRLALACKDRVLIFEQTRAPRNDWAEGHNAALGGSAMYEAEPDETSLYLRVTPGNPDRPPIRRRLALIPPAASPGWDNIVCGIAVSQDQRTLAVRYAEAQGPDYFVVGKPIRNHSVVIYSGLDPVTGSPGTAAPIQIQLLTQDSYAEDAAREYRNQRILQLSPDGKYLLVGTRVTYESSLAELYRTADGKLIHYWVAGQLSGSVTSIGNSEYFADASLTSNSIRLISWQTGTVQREIQTPGRVIGVCGAASGQQLLASIEGKSIACYDVATGSLLRTINSNLLPICCSPDDKVFIGYLPELPDHGSMLLADGQSGAVLAVLSRGTRRNTIAQFTSDGQSFLLGGNLTTSELVRNLPPDAADRMLEASGNVETDLAAESSTLEPPPAKVLPTPPPIESDVAPLPTIDSADMARLTASVGTRAIVQGTITSTFLSPSNTYMIIDFGEGNNCFHVFVPPPSYPKLNARFGGSAHTVLRGKLVRTTGIIVTYRELPEIVLDDPAQIELINTPANTSPDQ
ncbi:MAG TPA: hypothetical protein VL992_09255, partial [Tepidisphaeraceae bacterium]|nr:hypothetical protein [Tepidisphaeraceae bacterium]